MTKKAITKPSKLGPGEYLPDPTQSIQRIEDLPRPKVLKQSRNYPHRLCPGCGRAAYRDRVFHRRLHDTCTCGKCRCVGDLVSGRPHEIDLVYSQHHCSACRKYFSVDTSDLAPPGGRYTHRVMALAVRSVVEDGLAYRNASWRLWRDHRAFVPFATIQNWVEAGGKKGD